MFRNTKIKCPWFGLSQIGVAGDGKYQRLSGFSIEWFFGLQTIRELVVQNFEKNHKNRRNF